MVGQVCLKDEIVRLTGGIDPQCNRKFEQNLISSKVVSGVRAEIL